MKVLFQFGGAATPKDRRRVVTRIENEGARRVKRMFPRERDAELANLHFAEVDDEKAGEILRLLNGDEHVDYAEIPPTRGL
jgi:hypothetical protein